MVELETMYPGIAFSPQTKLTAAINETETVISVESTAGLPDGPNYATIGTDENAETIYYAVKLADQLSGCVRGVEGTAKAWAIGDILGRNFTAKDYEAILNNLLALKTEADSQAADLAAHTESIQALESDLAAAETNLEETKNALTEVEEAQEQTAAQLEQSKVYNLAHSKSGTIHTLTGLPTLQGVFVAQFTATADFTEGDTFADYTAKPNGEESALADKAFVADDIVSVVVDTINKKLGFKSGGGSGGEANSIVVTTFANATVTAVKGSLSVSAVADSSGVATLVVPEIGQWDVTATNGTISSLTIAVHVMDAFPALAPLVNSTFSENTWDVIKEVVVIGEAANYWSIGDSKPVTINGKVGATTFSSLSVDAFIISFSHNPDLEGANRMHMLLGKISGKMVGLCDGNYGSHATTRGAFTMNISATNSGGWSNSHMRKTVLGSNSTPTSPTLNTLLAALPSELRAVMAPATKYTDNTGTAANTEACVTATTDYLWLLSEYEVQGKRSHTNEHEYKYQAQYAYFSAGNSKIAYKHSSTSTAVWWRLRSPYNYNTANFVLVSTGGSSSNVDADYSGAVLAGFAIGSAA